MKTDFSDRPWHRSGLTLAEIEEALDLDYEVLINDEYTDKGDGLKYTRYQGYRHKTFSRPMFQLIYLEEPPKFSLYFSDLRPTCPVCDDFSRTADCPVHGDAEVSWLEYRREVWGAMHAGETEDDA